MPNFHRTRHPPRRHNDALYPFAPKPQAGSKDLLTHAQERWWTPHESEEFHRNGQAFSGNPRFAPPSLRVPLIRPRNPVPPAITIFPVAFILVLSIYAPRHLATFSLFALAVVILGMIGGIGTMGSYGIWKESLTDACGILGGRGSCVREGLRFEGSFSPGLGAGGR